MKRLIQFKLKDNDEIIVVEVDEPEQEGGMDRVARFDEVAEEAKQTFEHAIDKIKPIANIIISRLHEGLTKPADEVGVEFGMKMNAKFGAIIADAGAEAQFKITLKWKRKE